MNMSSKDLTTTARIRRAALELFGGQGYERTTMRQIAHRAEVSLGLVNHHFGSKDGLRQACDDWVLNYILSEKLLVVTGGSLPELTRYVAEHPELEPIMTYVTRSLRDGGLVADGIFDALVAITRDLTQAGVAEGTMKPGIDEEARAVVLSAFSVGSLIFGQAIARHLGGVTLLDADVYQRFAAASLDILTRGVIVEGKFSFAEETEK